MRAEPPLYHLINLWITMTRYLHRASDARTEHFGSQTGDLLIRAAIYLGTIEGRPMKSAKLAAYVGIPRPTVVRRLRSLERRGLVELRDKKWRTPLRLVDQRSRQDFNALVRLVQTTNDRLKRPRNGKVSK